MSEYHFVEKPFLDQLKNLGWDIVEHPKGIPTNPEISLRENFRELVIKKVFKTQIKKINKTLDGIEWLTDKQLDDLYEEVAVHNFKSLIEANKEICKAITENTRVDKNEITGEEYPVVKIIDFENPLENSFIAINQFRIDTIGTAKECIIPDIVLFVNGIPFVVIECKYQNNFTANPMEESIRQLLRYQNRRFGSEGVEEREGEEKLFFFNQFVIATYGDEAKVGTISSEYEHFLEWKDIFPLKNADFIPPLGKIRSQEKLIQGMLPKETLLDIIKHFMVYMESSKGAIVKVVCRYQQYRAVTKIIEKMLTGKNHIERSGIIWHTQGSGKSLTMVFLVKKLRSIKGLSDYKVIMINDRTDLEEQLGDTATLTGETVNYIENTEQLKKQLSNSKSNLNMVMIHKFLERQSETENKILAGILNEDLLPEYKTFGVINKNDKIVISIDEAHRTQSSDLGMNMFNAFPNAVKIAFTGTPLITDRNKKKTTELFGKYIDKYRLNDAVNDGATLQILYEGKTADTALNEKGDFDAKFEDMFKERTAEEILAIKKKYGTTGDIMEAHERIKGIAKDLVKYYVENILPDNFKAQVVASSKKAAVLYKNEINEELKRVIEIEENKKMRDEELIKKLKFLKAVAVTSADGTNETPDITMARKEALETQAIDFFKKKFDYSKENTGIAFLCVCDMLLTGFDAPIEQVMFLDKKMVEHNLPQAITRVNRTASGKDRGYIVDYIGIANNLAEALEIYNSGDEDEVETVMESLATEIPVLNDRYIRLIRYFEEKGIKRIQEYVEYKIIDMKEQYSVLEECIELMEDVNVRASFDVYFKKFLQSMNIVLPNKAGLPYKAPMQAFGHIYNRVQQRYKDNSINLAGVGNKVKKLINEHLISLGINPEVPPTEIFSTNFREELEKHNLSFKSKASEMEHAMRKHFKINFDIDPALYERFSEKLDKIIQRYMEDTKERYEALKEFFGDIKKGRGGEKSDNGLNLEKEAPFYDLMMLRGYKDVSVSQDIKAIMAELTIKIVTILSERIKIIDFWNKPSELKDLTGDIDELILFSGLDNIIDIKEQLTADIIDLAKKRHNELVK